MSGSRLTLTPRPLTAAAFAPYGEVIGAGAAPPSGMNDERFQRFDALATLDISGRAGISIARCLLAETLPRECTMVERHPLGSQAFIPLSRFRFVVVVAPPGKAPRAATLAAFVTDGGQGVNYHRGTWHVPLIGLEAGQEYLIVDRCDAGENCETHTLSPPVWLAPPPGEDRP